MSNLGNTTLKAGSVKFKVTKNSDEITIIMGDEKRKVKMLDLWMVVFALSDSEHKDKIMPVQKKEVMKFKKVHTVQVKNDMKAGETLTFTSVIDVPTWMAEGFKNLIDGDEEGEGAIPSPLTTVESA
jgi:hypothetical protein